MTTTTWWQQATAAALLGTARREPPALPAELGVTPRPGASLETALLDAAAVGGALLRLRPATTTRPATVPAPSETTPDAPPRATQLLGLLLDQPPVAARLRPRALRRWLEVAAQRGVRVPHPLLPRLLALATQQVELRPVVAPVLGERGRWLAGLRADWAWALDPAPTGGRPRAQQVPPVDAWRALSAAERLAALEELGPPDVPPGADDLLEAALDDRSEKVRRQACLLLDGSPSSPRGQRMAARLRALVSPAGRLRRSLEIGLPTEPDATGVRDGLTSTRAGSQRERWLELICAGAPLSTWTALSGKDPAHTWPLITQPAARAGVLRAVRARRDVVWAAAALADAPDLLAVLPLDARDAAAVRLVRADRSLVGVGAVLQHGTATWSAELSAAVVDVLRHTPPTPGTGSTWLVPLAAGLHPASRPAVSAWARAEHRWGSLPADIDQYLSFLPAITEAFG